MIRFVINGASGRMGARLRALADEDARFEVVGLIDETGILQGRETIDRGEFDAVIDLSSDAGAQAATDLATAHGAALLVGTTGLSAPTLASLEGASSRIPVLVAANMAIGIAVMKSLARRAARLLGESWDIALVEFHHSAKKDAPSGTALRLVKAVEEGSGRRIAPGNVLAVRAGDIVGEHSIRFAAAGEYLEITHRATTRDLFVRGALRAAAWLARQPAGMYSIEQAIGLEEETP